MTGNAANVGWLRLNDEVTDGWCVVHDAPFQYPMQPAVCTRWDMDPSAKGSCSP